MHIGRKRNLVINAILKQSPKEALESMKQQAEEIKESILKDIASNNDYYKKVQKDIKDYNKDLKNLVTIKREFIAHESSTSEETEIKDYHIAHLDIAINNTHSSIKDAEDLANTVSDKLQEYDKELTHIDTTIKILTEIIEK